MNTATKPRPAAAPAQHPAAHVVPPVERQPLVARIASSYGVEPGKLLATLTATAFKADRAATDAEMMALLVVAEQYKLNPFTKELFAFLDKNKGIVPIVSVDGWARIVNEHPEFNGMQLEVFDNDAGVPDHCTCTLHRKDRAHPIVVTEYFVECKRETGPWKSHPRRMLRHKAFIQCARLAFGFAGIYDEDEAHRIIEAEVLTEPAKHVERGAKGLKSAVVGATDAGAQSTQQPEPPKPEKPEGTVEQRDAIVKRFGECKDAEILALVADESREFTWTTADQAVLHDAYTKRQGELAQ